MEIVGEKCEILPNFSTCSRTAFSIEVARPSPICLVFKKLVGAVAIDESKELMLISDGGTLVRTRASEVARTGRNAQGVRLIRLGNEEILVGVVAVDAVEVEDDILDASIETTEETVVDEVNVDASENTTDTNTSNED